MAPAQLWFYNGDGLRTLYNVATSVNTRYIWDELNLLLEKNSAGATQAFYTYNPLIYGNLISQRRGSTSHFPLFDGLGSTRWLTGSGQGITDTYYYKAYGVIASQTGTTNNPFKWLGRIGYYDNTLPVGYYVRARYYDEITARWMSRDPIGSAGSQWNLYEYVSSKPSLLIDPSGLVCMDCYWRSREDFEMIGGKPEETWVARFIFCVGPVENTCNEPEGCPCEGSIKAQLIFQAYSTAFSNPREYNEEMARIHIHGCKSMPLEDFGGGSFGAKMICDGPQCKNSDVHGNLIVTTSSKDPTQVKGSFNSIKFHWHLTTKDACGIAEARILKPDLGGAVAISHQIRCTKTEDFPE